MPIGSIPDAFRQAMDDDLGVGRALAVIHERVRAGNAALADANHDGRGGDRRGGAGDGRRARHRPVGGAVGRHGGEDRRLIEATGNLIEALLVERATARAERDFARADAIRVRLAEAGFAIEDTKDGPVWSVAGRAGGWFRRRLGTDAGRCGRVVQSMQVK